MEESIMVIRSRQLMLVVRAWGPRADHEANRLKVELEECGYTVEWLIPNRYTPKMIERIKARFEEELSGIKP